MTEYSPTESCIYIEMDGIKALYQNNKCFGVWGLSLHVKTIKPYNKSEICYITQLRPPHLSCVHNK